MKHQILTTAAILSMTSLAVLDAVQPASANDVISSSSRKNVVTIEYPEQNQSNTEFPEMPLLMGAALLASAAIGAGSAVYICKLTLKSEEVKQERHKTIPSSLYAPQTQSSQLNNILQTAPTPKPTQPLQNQTLHKKLYNTTNNTTSNTTNTTKSNTKSNATNKTSNTTAELTGYIKRAYNHFKLGDIAKAIDDFNEAIRSYPRSSYLYSERANFRRKKLNDQHGAIEDYTQAIDIHPQNPLLYLWRSQAYHDLGDERKAVQDYNMALRLAPENTMFHYFPTIINSFD
jgi:tetratricopeptide (TPR) repeat protein